MLLPFDTRATTALRTTNLWQTGHHLIFESLLQVVVIDVSEAGMP